MPTCPDCGAAYEAGGDDCRRRFDALLALDHSRTEPWGSRHGLAFSAFSLQHPEHFPPDVAERAWIMLYSVYVAGRDYLRVTAALRRLGRHNPSWDVPLLPSGRPTPPFTVTIADLGSFAPETYPEQLDRWCRATLDRWRLIEVIRRNSRDSHRASPSIIAFLYAILIELRNPSGILKKQASRLSRMPRSSLNHPSGGHTQ